MGAGGISFSTPCTRSSLLDSFDVCPPAMVRPQGHSLLYNFNDFATSFYYPYQFFL